MSILDRKMLHATSACPYQCQYCFSKWENYKYQNAFIKHKDNLLIYPFCDSELEFQDYRTILSTIAEQADINKSRIIISISTKSNLKEEILSELQLIHEKLDQYGGFVKISISFTNKSFPSIEEGTAPYIERINLLKRLMKYQIKTSVVLKPILPFVPSNEYVEILNDTCDFSNKFLIGGLYVNNDTDLYRDYIQGKYETVLRNVNWLDGENWLYVDSWNTQQVIKDHLAVLGKEVFESDQELIESWL